MSEERRFDYVDRGRRLGRLRAGRPADGGSVGPGLPDRGGPPRPQPADPHPGRAVRHQQAQDPQLALLDGAAGGDERRLGLHPARPRARRLELDQRHGLYPGPPQRLRRLEGGGQHRLGPGRRAAVLHQGRGQRGVPRFGSARQRRPPQRHLLSSRRSSYFRPSTTPLRISWIGSVSSCPAFDAKQGTYSELSRPARRRGPFSNDFARRKRRLDDSSSRSRTSAPPGTSPRSTCTASGGYSKITSVASAIGCAVTLWLLGRRYPSSSSSRAMRAVRGP
jgi:hypothetical protein